MSVPDTIPARLQEAGRARGSAPAYYEKVEGKWNATSWADYAAQVRQATRALCTLGFQPGHTVCILGFNRPEWVIMDVAAMTAGGAPAGIYTTCSPPEVAYIVNHSEAGVVLLENESQWKKVEEKLGELPHLKHVVMMRLSARIDHPMVMSWEQFLAKGNQTPDMTVEERLRGLKPEDLATMIYTSGTTGPPKAVMLSHRNLTWTADVARQIVSLTQDDCSVSYLPLSHIAEQMFTIHAPITARGSIWYAESMEKLKDNLVEAQPTVIFGVPRVWEKIHAGLTARLREATGVKASLVSWARGVATRVDQLRASDKQPDYFLNLQYSLASKLVFSKIKAALGLGRARVMVSGAAPIGKDVIDFFSSLDLPICEVYGQSEDCGPTSFNLPNRRKSGSVGPAIPGVEIRLAADDEIHVRGPNVFMGYYKDEQATAETLQDGWLLSGDLGKFDSEGFLYITGRKKEIIITAGGKNIAPKNIEAALKRSPLVAEAVVIGDRRPYLIALLCLEPDALAKFAAENGISGDLHTNPKVQAEIQKAVEECNAEFARVEHVRKFAILPRLLTEAAGELTPTQKIKRKIVNKNWADVIEGLYQGGGE
jgi:long-chain acyl-CoA synthetase